MITALFIVAMIALLAIGSFLVYRESEKTSEEKADSKYFTSALVGYLKLSPVIVGFGVVLVVFSYVNDGNIVWGLAGFWVAAWLIGMILLWAEAPAFVEKFDKNFFFILSVVCMILAAGAAVLAQNGIGSGIDNYMLMIGIFTVYAIGLYVSGKEARKIEVR